MFFIAALNILFFYISNIKRVTRGYTDKIILCEGNKSSQMTYEYNGSIHNMNILRAVCL